MVAGLNGEGLVVTDLSSQHQNRGDYLQRHKWQSGHEGCCFFLNTLRELGRILGSQSDLEVVVAGQGNEEVEKETLAVFVDLWPVVVQTCQLENTTS